MVLSLPWPRSLNQIRNPTFESRMKSDATVKRVFQDQKKKKNRYDHDEDNKKKKRVLINISVIGSSGPIRFVVNEGDLVAAVISTALKIYAREGRLPLLGSDVNGVVLYCANDTSNALMNPWEAIGSRGARSFLLCKKKQSQQASMKVEKKPSSGWKAWLNKSFTFKTHCLIQTNFSAANK